MIEKASIYTMNALNKSSELWHTSVNRKARPVVEGEHYKNWNDHGKVYICWIIVCVDHLEELRTEKVIQVEFSQIQLSEWVHG